MQISIETHRGNLPRNDQIGHRAIAGRWWGRETVERRWLAITLVRQHLDLHGILLHIDTGRQPRCLAGSRQQWCEQQSCQRVFILFQRLLEAGQLLENLHIGKERYLGVRAHRLLSGRKARRLRDAAAPFVCTTIQYRFQHLGFIRQQQLVPDNRMHLVGREGPSRDTSIIGRFNAIRIPLLGRLTFGDRTKELMHLLEDLSILRLNN